MCWLIWEYCTVYTDNAFLSRLLLACLLNYWILNCLICWKTDSQGSQTTPIQPIFTLGFFKLSCVVMLCFRVLKNVPLCCRWGFSFGRLWFHTFKAVSNQRPLKAVTSRDKSVFLKAHIAFVSATMFCSLLPLSRWLPLESIFKLWECMVRNGKAAGDSMLAAKHEKCFPPLLEQTECGQMQTVCGLLIRFMRAD